VPHLGALQNLFFTVVEHGFMVLLPCTQPVKFDSNSFVVGSRGFPSLREIRRKDSPK
jgi:hypothetical protein